jgi:flagellar basal body-associated protein FliL
MAKKAKIDALDITINDHSEDEHQGEHRDEAVFDAEPDEKPSDGIIPKLIAWIRRPLAWILLVSVVLLGSITGALIHFLNRDDAKAPTAQQKQKVEQGIQARSVRAMQPVQQITFFEGFVVDQKDDKGNVRMVFCDIALEQENVDIGTTVNGERLDIRNVIHMTLRREIANTGPEGRSRLKSELKKELNTLLGENWVKNIYFTRYEVN